MKNEKFCSQLSTYFQRHGYLGARGLSSCVEGKLGRLKPRKEISKIGLSWMKVTMDFSF
jgi:hypothetical protein